MVRSIELVIYRWPPLFNIAIQNWRGRKRKVTHKLGIEPRSPGPNSNALPTKSPLFPSESRVYSHNQQGWLLGTVELPFFNRSVSPMTCHGMRHWVWTPHMTPCPYPPWINLEDPPNRMAKYTRKTITNETEFSCFMHISNYIILLSHLSLYLPWVLDEGSDEQEDSNSDRDSPCTSNTWVTQGGIFSFHLLLPTFSDFYDYFCYIPTNCAHCNISLF